MSAGNGQGERPELKRILGQEQAEALVWAARAADHMTQMQGGKPWAALSHNS